jgi:N-acetyl-gamma-glutamyl-phosphate reductase
MTFNVGVVGASGYTGQELLRLISEHADLNLKVITGHSTVGVTVGNICNHLIEYSGLIFESFEQAKGKLYDCDLIFLSLPHCESAQVANELKDVAIIVDLSGDHRLKDATLYEGWYGKQHPYPSDLTNWVYGLPELFRADLKGATRIANPGCYPTVVTLSLAPLVARSVITTSIINAVCISGTSGAGRTASMEFQYSNAESNLRAYKVTNHQHIPEIEANLNRFVSGADRGVDVNFMPVVGPYSRGILANISATMKEIDLDQAGLMEIFQEAYRDEPFIRITSDLPSVKQVRGSNMVYISPVCDRRLGLVKVCAVIDNLVKGAAGQAIQNANIALGLTETRGLSRNGFYP